MRPDTSPQSADVRRLVFLFGLAYFAQGLGQAGGLISQPLNYYLKQGLGLDSAQVSDYLAILTLPWMIKPLYGLVSDYLPLFGYRRKTWLLLVNLAAAGGFLWLAGLTQAGTIVIALTLTAFGTAASDVIIDALMVENGERTGMTARFQGMQWLWFKLAAIVTALSGGLLASLLEPATALHVAATVTMLAPLSVLVAGLVLVREERAPVDLAQARATTRAVLDAFRSPTLRIAVAFLALWCFSPAFGTPLYHHMVDNLKFDQRFIGQLNALTAAGGVAGAWLFAHIFADKSITARDVQHRRGGGRGPRLPRAGAAERAGRGHRGSAQRVRRLHRADRRAHHFHDRRARLSAARRGLHLRRADVGIQRRGTVLRRARRTPVSERLRSRPRPAVVGGGRLAAAVLRPGPAAAPLRRTAARNRRRDCAFRRELIPGLYRGME